MTFFSLGRTIASLRASGNEPSRKDALHILARVSANNGSSRFTSHVGAGSIEQCFAGALCTILDISSAVTSSNIGKLVHILFAIIGAGALAVSSRILSIFERKKLAKSAAVCDDGVTDCGVFSSMLTFDHRALESCAFAAIVSDQYSTYR